MSQAARPGVARGPAPSVDGRADLPAGAWPGEWEVGGCPLGCGGGGGRVLLERGAHRVVRCEGCGIGFLTPRPTAAALRALYEDPSYFCSPRSGVGYDDYEAESAHRRATAGRRLRAVERALGRRGRLLDLGAGFGYLLGVARGSGWEAIGTDLSPYAAAVARERVGAHVLCGPLEALALPGGSFDAIVLEDVLEHLPDPVGVLRECRRLLKGTGLFSATTPDLDGLLARLMGDRWVSWKVPEHLYYFGRAGLVALLLRAGLRPVALTGAWQRVSVRFLGQRLAEWWGQGVGALVGRGLAGLLGEGRGVWLPSGSVTVLAAPGDAR